MPATRVKSCHRLVRSLQFMPLDLYASLTDALWNEPLPSKRKPGTLTPRAKTASVPARHPRDRTSRNSTARDRPISARAHVLDDHRDAPPRRSQASRWRRKHASNSVLLGGGRAFALDHGIAGSCRLGTAARATIRSRAAKLRAVERQHILDHELRRVTCLRIRGARCRSRSHPPFGEQALGPAAQPAKEVYGQHLSSNMTSNPLAHAPPPLLRIFLYPIGCSLIVDVHDLSRQRRGMPKA